MKFSKEQNIQLNRLSKCDNYHTLVAVLVDWSLIILSIMISQYSLYFYPLSILVIGSRQRALATILHDAVHDRAAENKILNYLIGTVFSGFWVFQCFNAYKKSHVMLHHGSLGNENNDPDFQFYIAQGLYKGISKKQFLKSYVIYPLLLLKTFPYFSYLVKHRLTSFYKFRKELIQFILFWSIILLLIFKYGLFLLLLSFWIVPYFTTFIIIGHFIELAEHFPLLGNSDKPIEMSRNRFSHWIEGFFLSIHNENYHLTHHLRPRVHFWNLKKAHEIMMNDPLYNKVNLDFGGIFLSADRYKVALVPGLLTGKIPLPKSLH